MTQVARDERAAPGAAALDTSGFRMEMVCRQCGLGKESERNAGLDTERLIARENGGRRCCPPAYTA